MANYRSSNSIQIKNLSKFYNTIFNQKNEPQKEGDIYTWGQSTQGQLGIGKVEQKYLSIPEMVSLPTQVLKISCGAGHVMALTVDYKVYTWGCNVLGQLGLGDTQTRNSPNLVNSLLERQVSEIKCGAGHCLALDRYGVVYSWGASADF